MSREGKHYKFRQLRFWACSGMVCMQDERRDAEDPRSFDVVMVREMLCRARAVNGEIHLMPYAGERAEHHKLVEDIIACCREAQRQGRPDDPRSVADMLKARRRSWVMGVGKDGRSQTGVTHVLGSAEAPESSLLPPVPNHPDVLDTSKVTLISG